MVIFNMGHRHQNFGRDLLAQPHISAKLFPDGAHQGFPFQGLHLSIQFRNYGYERFVVTVGIIYMFKGDSGQSLY